MQKTLLLMLLPPGRTLKLFSTEINQEKLRMQTLHVYSSAPKEGAQSGQCGQAASEASLSDLHMAAFSPGLSSVSPVS